MTQSTQKVASAARTVAARPTARVTVRETRPGDGTALAALCWELGEAHDGWGGYPGSRDPGVYAELAQRLDADARARACRAAVDPRLHLIAEVGGAPCGQVEAQVERHGSDPKTPFTCSFRSLIVTSRARELGVGRILLDALARSARILTRGARCVLSGEVLEPNPALGFYDHLGYVPIAYAARVKAAVVLVAPELGGARLALPGDAAALARLDGILAARRRAGGDMRFDPPREVEPGQVAAIAARLASAVGTADVPNPATLVSVDSDGAVQAAAFFVVQELQAPLVPGRRGLLQCFALDPDREAAPIVRSVVASACRLALAQGASHVEVTDLSPPGTELHASALAAGAAPWSRLVAKLV